MENRAHAIAAVSFLVVLTVAAVFMFYWLSSGPAAPRAYRIVTQQSVAGLAPNSAVMFKGLQIGHVQSIRFDPGKPARVIVDFRVQRDAYVTHATYAIVAMKGLLGGKVLKLKLGEGSRRPLETSTENPAHIPLREGLIGQLKDAAARNLKALHAVLARSKKLLGKTNRKHIATTIRQLETLTTKLVSVTEQLTPTIKQLPQLLASLQETLDQTRTVLADARDLVGQAQGPVKKAGELEETIQHLGRRLNNQTLPSIHTLTQSLTRTSRLLQQLTRELTAKPQSVIFGPPRPSPGPGEPGFDANGR